MNQTASSIELHNGPALRDQADAALNECDSLHKYLDELEAKLFAPRPAEVTGMGGRAETPPPLGVALEIVGSRLGNATSRLARILAAL